MLQRVLQRLDPTGRARAALRRWWRRPTAPAAERDVRLHVTCFIVGDDPATLRERCATVLAQDWRPLAVVVAAPADVLAALPPAPDLLRLPLPPDLPPAAARAELGELVEDFELLADGPAANGTLALLVATLRSQTGHDQAELGGWRLCRRRGLTPPADARRITADTPLDTGPARAGPLAFDDDPDLPYRWRRTLAGSGTTAYATDARTHERLRLLAAVDTRPRLMPARLATPRPIVLQADDFTEGGMEQVVIDLAEALATQGFAPRLWILGREGSAADRARRRGLVVERLTADPASYTARLAALRPALVNAHYSTFGAAAAAAAGIPFVQTLHNMYAWFGPELIAIYRQADPHTHAYVCVSNNVARYADLTLGLPPSRMLVVPNGCHPDYLASDAHRQAAARLRDELGLPAGAPVFLNVASVQPPKGQAVLLGAFAAIAASAPSAHLIVLGGAADGDYLSAQQRRTDALGLTGRVHWVGRRDDVSAFHQLAWALVQPSFFEGWSLAITEAVLAGLPVIATDVGGAVEQLRGTSGILVPAAMPDVTALHRDTLVPLLRHPCTGLERDLVVAMQEILRRGGARSPLPDDWRQLLRDTAYRRCAEVFHWFAGGGGPRSARHWTGPLPDGEGR